MPSGHAEVKYALPGAISHHAIKRYKWVVTEAAKSSVDDALRIPEGAIAIPADAIISIDDRQRIVSYGHGAEAVFGWTRDEVIGQFLDVLIAERCREELRRHIEAFAKEPVGARRMGGRRPAFFGLRKSGVEFPVEAAFSMLLVDDVQLYTIVLRDTTAQRRMERDQRFLSDVGAVLATSLDYDDILSRIAELTVRFLADGCIVDVVQDDETIRRWKVVLADPHKRDLADEMQRFPLDRTMPHLAAMVLKTRRLHIVEDIAEDYLRSIAQGPEHLDQLRRLLPRAVMGLPMFAHGRFRGALVLIRSHMGHPFSSEDVVLGQELASRAGYAIDSAQLFHSAQEAIRMRDDVVRMVAHDLRNPLNAARIAAGLLLERAPDACEYNWIRQAAERIDRTIGRADHLIEQLLDVTRIESGGLAIEASRVPASDILADVDDTFAALATAASLELRVERAGPLPDVSADRERLLQVFSNLVGNAIKFTPPGGSIRVGAVPEGDVMCFFVTDTGPGISAEDLPRLFDRFWKASRHDRRGTGLGLAIAKGIVDAHGGRISVESTPGAGSTFRFSIPMARVVTPPQEVLAPDAEGGEGYGRAPPSR